MGINEKFLSAERGIIIAADVSSLDELTNLIVLVRQVPEVSSIKIGFTLVIRYGLDSVVKTRLYPIKPQEQGRKTNGPIPCWGFAHTPPVEQSSLNTETAINAV